MPDVSAVIREYALAHEAAKDNQRLLIEDSVRWGTLCAERMRRVHTADHALYALGGTPDLPEPVVEFLAAHADRGCHHCWVSSRRRFNHPDCNEKITRWFTAQGGLVRYGLELSEAECGATQTRATGHG